ncbi:MAG TPA: multicopper oxidase domain-containing protein [Gemmatimonadaceae bacterium]|nr:multicopper oxidase domain-containing protein [Gemmatimonadaceae bacterium]
MSPVLAITNIQHNPGGRMTVRDPRRGGFGRAALLTSLMSFMSFMLFVVFTAVPSGVVHAQNPQPVACPAEQLPLITIPEIKSVDKHLRATLKLVDGVRTMWGSTGDNRCATQNLRYFMGYDPAHRTPWPTGPEPIPGPTFRAQVGDLVEITFFNQINVNNFAGSLDHADMGDMSACDQYSTSTSRSQSRMIYGGSSGPDSMPNCLHGSSTTNIHFHGTHTTPSTTGDNVLLFIRPSLRSKSGVFSPSETQVDAMLAGFYSTCEAKGPPTNWAQMPVAWRTLQKNLIQTYDKTAPYQGKNGALPASMRLWPVDSMEIARGLWPQYQLGANPYCFPLPNYNPATMRMGQAPGTHWYHAHKHGSTALNVANGMTGAFIIEGQYDVDLHRYYPNLVERVLMLQQLSTAPFPLTTPSTRGPGAARPQISVNGRLDPVVTMRPGEVQLWRTINGAFRDAVEFMYTQGPPAQNRRLCDSVNAPATNPVQWRQIAQDGVQFSLANYQQVGTANAKVNLAPANRADFLVSAPSQPGTYTVCIVRNSALFVQPGAPAPPDRPSVLLTVNVTGNAIVPAQTFIPDAQFPTFPPFLTDITPGEIKNHRELVFGPGNSTINGKMFQDTTVDQAMLLNTAEEWVVKNQANDKSHPFHIHINPFQIIEMFEPNAPEALNPSSPCYVNPADTTTFKPCATRQPKAPWVWWDTFAIPTGRQVTLSCTKLEDCPAQLRPFTECTTQNGTTTCVEFIPGWFKMRSRFVDFTGMYVLHCHILIHEDRGMMQLIEVVPSTTPYRHR